jgi:hypothetical protein
MDADTVPQCHPTSIVVPYESNGRIVYVCGICRAPTPGQEIPDNWRFEEVAAPPPVPEIRDRPPAADAKFAENGKPICFLSHLRGRSSEYAGFCISSHTYFALQKAGMNIKAQEFYIKTKELGRKIQAEELYKQILLLAHEYVEVR